jgi:hypothetical protein
MQNLQFSNDDKQRLREFTGHAFGEQRIHVGDLVDFMKGGFKEIGEVTRGDGGYHVGGKPLEGLEIVRVIDMGGINANGRYA